MAKETSPLLRRRSFFRLRPIAMSLAGTCAVVAMVAIVFIISGHGSGKRSILLPLAAQPYFYVPLAPPQFSLQRHSHLREQLRQHFISLVNASVSANSSGPAANSSGPAANSSGPPGPGTGPGMPGNSSEPTTSEMAGVIWDHFICGGEKPLKGCPDNVENDDILELFSGGEVVGTNPEKICTDQELLKLMDADSDGKVSRDEFVKAFEIMSKEPPGGGPPAVIKDAVAECMAARPFVCTVANIVALSQMVQTKWNACKSNPGYEEPNKGAKRRLMEWVWEPPAGEAAAYPTAKPSYSPSSYEMVMKQRSLYSMLNGAANETTATPAPRDMSECMEDAFITPGHGACADIHSCEDAVCDPSGLIGGGHYYNEPEIEALCGMCMMRYGGVFGCFAKHSQVMVAGKGATPIGQIEVDDEVLSAEGNSRVFFIHDHKKASKTLRIATEQDSMELTPVHYLPVYTEACGERYCSAAKQVRAESVRVGDRVYVHSAMGFLAKEVTGVSQGMSSVRYVLTESGSIVVNGVVASVYSTGAGFFETLPFRLLDALCKGALQAAPVAAALRTLLDSPLLQTLEAALHALTPSPALPPSLHAPAPSILALAPSSNVTSGIGALRVGAVLLSAEEREGEGLVRELGAPRG